MTTGRHLVDAKVANAYAALLVKHANRLPVGNPMSGHVALGPLIDETQRDRVHAMVTDSVAAGATLAAGGTYEELFYRPTVLTNVPVASPAYRQEVFGLVAPVVSYSTIDEAVAMASASPYGLSLSIISGDGLRALELARRIPTGAIHINDATPADEATIPFGGVGDSGNGSRMGGHANLDACTETQWVTAQADIALYPFWCHRVDRSKEWHRRNARRRSVYSTPLGAGLVCAQNDILRRCAHDVEIQPTTRGTNGRSGKEHTTYRYQHGGRSGAVRRGHHSRSARSHGALGATASSHLSTGTDRW